MDLNQCGVSTKASASVHKNKPLKSAEAASKIQFAVSLLTDGMNALLTDKVGQKNALDFNKSLYKITKKLKVLFPDSAVQSQLCKLLMRAREIRNKYSHQDFDFNRFEHDVECLLKLASLMGLSECYKEIEKFAEVPHEDWEKLKAEGNEHYKNKRWTEAMNCYTNAIKVNAKVAILYSNRALCELRLSKLDLAREDAEDAIQLDPTEVKFYRILSEVLEKLQLYKEALEVCEEGLKVDPRDEILLLRGRACRALVVDEEKWKEPETEKDEFPAFVKPTAGKSEVSPDEYYVMDSLMHTNYLEITNALKISSTSRGVASKEYEAFKIFESVAKRGSAEGLYNMAIMYATGKAGLARDLKKSFDLCLQAAKLKPYLKLPGNIIRPNTGVAEAENEIAMAYRDGRSVNRDVKQAFEWFLRSATHGCPSAMNNLALAFANGIGCERNLASARLWFQKSADLKFSEAQANLARMLLNGEGGPVDKVKATELFKAAADQGFPGALESYQRLIRSCAVGATPMKVSCNSVGKVAAAEPGRTKKEENQNRNIEATAENSVMIINHRKAMLLLGDLLLLERKNEDAVFFIRKAADGGDAHAQWTLGQLLALGHGCERDEIQARRWLLCSQEEDQVERTLATFAMIVEFEADRNLTCDGFTVMERIERFFSSFFPSETKEFSLGMLQFLKERQGLLSHPERGVSLLLDWPKIRANEGSKTVQMLRTSIKMIKESLLACENQKLSEAFRLFRMVTRVWDLLPIDFTIWKDLFDAANKTIKTNPSDADALYIIVSYKLGAKLSSSAELLSVAFNCIRLNPEIADSHRLLSCIYGLEKDYKSALNSIKRALEIECEPNWLYEMATFLRLQDSNDRQEVIKAYEEFILANDSDHRNIPEAFYCIGNEYLLFLKDEKLAREYFEKGLRAESPEVRLPWYEPIDNFVPKKNLKFLLDLPESMRSKALESLRSEGVSRVSEIHELSNRATCSACGKLCGPLRCSRCNDAHYCDRDCQLKHWKEHKRHCRSK